MHGALRIGKTVVLTVLRGVWLSTLVLLPLFGMWLASSLAAYHNASLWLSLLVGLLLFPIVPVGWDLLFVWRMRRFPDRKRILTRVDRLVLRTLIVSLVFVGGLAWQKPVTVYKALSVRGDWMLDGHHGPTATWVRARLFTVADWFRRGWTPGGDDHHYGESDEAPSLPPPEPEPTTPEQPTVSDEPTTPDAPMTPDAPPEPPLDSSSWPMPATVDPIVATMPADAQVSIASIGAYLAANIPDARRRVKAVHDIVVARVSYDDAALAAIQTRRWDDVPSMEADAVFARGRGVCAGYAHLMTALGTAAGLEIAYVTGFARSGVRDGGSLEGNEHAWNAAKLDGRWYPIDATWDDGQDRYSTSYLLAPPSVFILDHFPADAAWQLLAEPLSVSDFLRQPTISVELKRLGLTLRSPERSQVSASGSLEVVLDNPRRRDVMATVAPADTELGDHAKGRDCGEPVSATTTRLRCSFGDGEWRVDLWGSPHGVTSMDYLGSIWVNSR